MVLSGAHLKVPAVLLKSASWQGEKRGRRDLLSWLLSGLETHHFYFVIIKSVISVCHGLKLDPMDFYDKNEHTELIKCDKNTSVSYLSI